ncbi:MAG: DNA primase [Candidatus Makaraimicrobium thalassicum]|nr:MAG: DNA primase [Candidatus Omnitrophota bacterium]
MGRIPQEVIDRILDRLDIVEVVSGYIQLKKTGRNFKANCPFHNEKTPSFVVSPDKQIYHCFGCGAGGNVINFVMKYESMDFPEAVEVLAARSGVDLPKYKKNTGEGSSLSAGLYEINKIAALFYQNSLRGEKGKKPFEYLKKRGIDTGTLDEFRIGYAPAGWETFRKYCEAKNIPADVLRKAGLTVPGEKGRGDYDRFRNRITFPIFNERGHIVAFGGRVMDDSLPKYINSPETAIYTKGNVLYGLNFSRKSIRETGSAVIVEGYMDVIIPFQRGITNIVAASGTALTQGQISMLRKYTNTAVMVFDADKAGESASLRGLDILVENGMDIRIATLPEGEDPDSFVRKNGKESFENIVNAAKGLFDYKLDILIERSGIRDIGGIVDEMLPTISKVGSAVIQSDYLKRLAERLGIHEASLRYEMGKVRPDYSYRYASESNVDRKSRNYRSSEIHLLGLAILGRDKFFRIQDELRLDMFRDRSVRKIIRLLGDLFNGGEKDINPGKLLSRLEKDEDAKTAVVQALAKMEITQDVDKALDDCIFCIRRENREDELKELTSRLKEAQQSNNNTEMRELLTRINMIHKEKVA